MSPRRTSVRIALASAIALGAVTAPAAASVADLERAQKEYDRGVELKSTKPVEARAAFAESAAILQHLVDEGADTSDLRFNLGNAYVQSGDLGRGIASYLRARQLTPYDPSILGNLATARTDVTTKITGDAVNDGSRLGWWRFVGEGTRLWLALSLWIVVWALIALPLVSPQAVTAQRQRVLRAVRAAAFLFACLIGSTVAIDRWLAATRTLGVVVANDVVVRKGNGEGFDAQVAEKLSPGVECMLLEQRPGWTRVRLADGTEGWVAEHQLVRVG